MRQKYNVKKEACQVTDTIPDALPQTSAGTSANPHRCKGKNIQEYKTHTLTQSIGRKKNDIFVCVFSCGDEHDDEDGVCVCVFVCCTVDEN